MKKATIFTLLFLGLIFIFNTSSVYASSGYCKPVYSGSNGYACRYKNGKWDYKVTRGVLDTVTHVMSRGLVSTLGNSYFHPKYRG